jgi:adenylylsulfate kinase-like enzyme
MAVYWITGFSGAGKTTIGTDFYQRLLSKGKTVLFLDGDELRLIMGGEDGYDKSSRRKLSFRYSRLCKLLADQDINVVIATISMFSEVRYWNRKNIDNYVEIYIKVPLNILVERDQKNLYTSKNKDVAGFNSQYEEPKDPDIILVNDNLDLPSVLTDKLEYFLDKANLLI